MAKKLIGHFDLNESSEEEVKDEILGALEDLGVFDDPEDEKEDVIEDE